MSWEDRFLEIEELLLWAGHLKYSVLYSEWYQSALYKCYHSLYIRSLENHAKNSIMSTFISILLWSKHMYFQRPKDSIKKKKK